MPTARVKISPHYLFRVGSPQQTVSFHGSTFQQSPRDPQPSNVVYTTLMFQDSRLNTQALRRQVSWMSQCPSPRRLAQHKATGACDTAVQIQDNNPEYYVKPQHTWLLCCRLLDFPRSPCSELRTSESSTHLLLYPRIVNAIS